MNIYNVAVGYLLSNVWRLTSCRFQPHCLTSVYVEMMLCIKEDSGELWLAGVLDWQLPPFVLLREDKDQIKIRGSAASPAMVEGAFFSSFFVKVKGCNWLPDHAHICWGGRLAERRLWQIYVTVMRILFTLWITLTASSVMNEWAEGFAVVSWWV